MLPLASAGLRTCEKSSLTCLMWTSVSFCVSFYRLIFSMSWNVQCVTGCPLADPQQFFTGKLYVLVYQLKLPAEELLWLALSWHRIIYWDHHRSSQLEESDTSQMVEKSESVSGQTGHDFYLYSFIHRIPLSPHAPFGSCHVSCLGLALHSLQA